VIASFKSQRDPVGELNPCGVGGAEPQWKGANLLLEAADIRLIRNMQHESTLPVGSD